MTKRLQVLLDDDELAAIQRVARHKRVSVAGWVREALRSARDRESTGDPREKLAALREAGRHSFPTADIDAMLGEIERGYAG